MVNSCHKHSQLCCVKENPGEGSDAPPTLERSGFERRVGAFNIPCPMGGKGLGESGGASLQGKGGRVGFRKKWFSKKVFPEKKILKSIIRNKDYANLYFNPFLSLSSNQSASASSKLHLN